MPDKSNAGIRGCEGASVTVEPTADLGAVRRLWHLLEPLHAVLYYAPEAFEEAA